MTGEEVQQLIEQRLEVLEPESMLLTDDSAQHVGHVGNKGGGHYHLTIVSKQFEGKRTLLRHRMIYNALGDLLPQHIHAIAIEALSPAAFDSSAPRQPNVG